MLEIFVGIGGDAMIVQAIALIVLRSEQRRLVNARSISPKRCGTKVIPMVETTHEMLQDSGPKVKVITDNLVETSHMVRSKAEEFDVTVSDVNCRTRAQVARVDGMVTSVLNTTIGDYATICRRRLRFR